MVMEIFKSEKEELVNSTDPAVDFWEMTGLWTICSLKKGCSALNPVRPILMIKVKGIVQNTSRVFKLMLTSHSLT